MSWQTYVDTNLVGSSHVTQAALLGLDGSIWAKSAKFPDINAVIAGTSVKESVSLVKDNFEVTLFSIRFCGFCFFFQSLCQVLPTL